MDIIADKRNRWTETEIELLRLNYPYIANSELTKLFPDRDLNSIVGKAGKLKLRKEIKRVSPLAWTEVEIEILREYYPLHGRAFVAEKINRSVVAVKKQAQLLNIKREGTYQKRTHFVNESFFENLNPLSCFVAGWICTDGNVINNTFRFELAKKDLNVLENIKRILQSENPITTGVKKPNDWIKKHRETVILTVNSKKMVSDLASNFDIVPRKTPIQKFPVHLDSENLSCFLIGVIEGDGCLHYGCYRKEKESRRFKLQITASNKNFLISIQQTLEKNYNILAAIQEVNRNGLSYYNLTLYNKKALTICMDLMLLAKKHKIPLLMRKWQNALDYAKYLLTNYSADS